MTIFSRMSHVYLRFVRFLLTYQRIIYRRISVNRFILFFLINTALVQISIAGGTSPATNTHVKFSIEVKRTNAKAGSTAEVLMRLQPEKGIHINLEPPISFVLDSSSVVTSKGKLEIPKKEKFLDTSKPLKQSFVFSSTVKARPQTIKGTLTYYYCSDAEGWCSKFKQPIEVTLKAVK